jgi:hypothetical protein
MSETHISDGVEALYEWVNDHAAHASVAGLDPAEERGWNLAMAGVRYRLDQIREQEPYFQRRAVLLDLLVVEGGTVRELAGTLGWTIGETSDKLMSLERDHLAMRCEGATWASRHD